MIQVIYNPQSRMCKTALRKMLKNDLPEHDEMNYVEIDMGKERLLDLANECLSLPLGYDKKAIVAENFYYLQKAKTKPKLLKGDESETLLSYFKNPDPSILLYLLVYSDTLDEAGDYFQALKEGEAKINPVGSFTSEQWPAVVAKFFEKRSIEIDKDAVAEIVNRVAGDYSTFLNEGQKLVSYSNGEKITKKVVEELVSQPLEDDMFQLSNALIAGNKKRAFKVYNDLKIKNIKGITLMNSLSKQLTFLHQVEFLNSRKLSSQEIAKELMCSVGRVNASLYSVRKMKDGALTKGIESLYEAQLAVMSGKKDEDLAFNLFLANFEL